VRVLIEKGQIWEDPLGNSWEVYQAPDLVGVVVMRRGPLQMHISEEILDKDSESGWKLIQGA
jgi:hypothetical protein